MEELFEDSEEKLQWEIERKSN